jgi:hypothetical protein
MSAMRIGRVLPAVCLASIVAAQTSWWRTYGGVDSDAGHSVQQTADGGYVVAGYSSSFDAGGSDVLLIKTNAQGDALWTRRYGGENNDEGRSVQQTADGGYIIAGQTKSFGVGTPLRDNVYVIKTNARGDTLWTRTYGGAGDDYGRCVRQTDDGGYIIAGTTTSFGPSIPYRSSIYAVKTNALGDTLWTRTYGGTRDYLGFSVQHTADGGYVIAGYCGTWEPNSDDVYLVKTDSNGDTVWTRTYGRTGNEWSNCIQEVTGGGYIMAGRTKPAGVREGDVYIIRTNPMGDTIWTRAYGGGYDDCGFSIQQTAGGGYIIAGYTYSFGAGTPNRNNIYLIGMDDSGDTLWTRAYGGTGYNEAYSVQQTAEGDYVITGVAVNDGTSADVSIIKTGLSQGRQACRQTGR